MNEFKEGDLVTIKSKETLIEELGKTDKGYPATNISWNSYGGMEHLYELSGTIAEIKDEAIYIDFLPEDKIKDKDYAWSFSKDCITTGPVLVKEPLREFMEFSKTPKPGSVWKELLAFQKTHKLQEGFAAYYFKEFFNVGIERIRKVLTLTEDLTELQAITQPKELMIIFKTYYPNVDSELLLLITEYLANPKEGELENALKNLLKKSPELNPELVAYSLAPIRRNMCSADDVITLIDFHWDHIFIMESLESVSVPSTKGLADYIKLKLVETLNNMKWIKIPTNASIEIGV